MPSASQLQIPPTRMQEVAAGGAVPSGTTVLTACRGLLIGTGGTINIRIGDTNFTLTVPAGVLPGLFEEVQTGGTVTGVWALF